MQALKAMNPEFVLLVGDLSYADGWGALWDTFGRVIQQTFAYIPLITTGGNHEVNYLQLAKLFYDENYLL